MSTILIPARQTGKTLLADQLSNARRALPDGRTVPEVIMYEPSIASGGGDSVDLILEKLWESMPWDKPWAWPCDLSAEKVPMLGPSDPPISLVGLAKGILSR